MNALREEKVVQNEVNPKVNEELPIETLGEIFRFI
jgi:hypothetical protein